MKAIIMSHEDGGSYCIDSTGSFHFVKGYENVDIGTEITIKVKKPTRIIRLWVACAAVFVVAVVVGFTCAKIASSQSPEAFENASCEAVVRLCANDNPGYCITDTGCTISCPRY